MHACLDQRARCSARITSFVGLENVGSDLVQSWHLDRVLLRGIHDSSDFPTCDVIVLIGHQTCFLHLFNLSNDPKKGEATEVEGGSQES